MAAARRSALLMPGSFAFALSACASVPPTPPAAPPATIAAATPAAEASANPGCWVHVFEDENFQDDNDIIRVPGRYPSMRNLPGAAKDDWGDEIDSIRVGPRAQFTGWEDEEFGDNRIDLGPGTERNNLRGDPDLGDEIDSMELRCF